MDTYYREEVGRLISGGTNLIEPDRLLCTSHHVPRSRTYGLGSSSIKPFLMARMAACVRSYTCSL